MTEKSRDVVSQLAKMRRLGRRAIHRVRKSSSDEPSTPVPGAILEVSRRRDPDRNLETTPPEDENIDLQCIWAVEFYTPAHVDTLLDSFRKLGWDKGGALGPRDNPVDWVQANRLHFYGGSWLNLHRYTVPLPENVEAASVTCYAVTPSLTCIVVCFKFEKDYRSRLDKALRVYRQTYARPSEDGRSCGIYEPGLQKSDDVLRIRSEAANLAANWFCSNLPGVFSSGLIEGELPVCEFVTLRKAEPFPKDIQAEDKTTRSYLRILGLDFSSSVWRSTDNPGLKFASHLRGRSLGDDRQHHSVLAARENDIDGDYLENWGGLENICSYVNERVIFLIGRWAILALLDGYNRILNSARDSFTINFEKQPTRRTIPALRKTLRNAPHSVDISAITADLISSIQRPSMLFYGMEDFEPCHDQMNQNSFSKSTCLVIGKRAVQLQKMDQSLRDLLNQYGSLMAATESIRMQELVIKMTWGIIFLAVVSLVISMASLIISIDIGDAISVLVAWLRSLDLIW